MLRIIVDAESIECNTRKAKQMLNGSEIELEVMPFPNGGTMTVWSVEDVEANKPINYMSDEEQLVLLEAYENLTGNDMIEKGWETIEGAFDIYVRQIA